MLNQFQTPTVTGKRRLLALAFALPVVTLAFDGCRSSETDDAETPGSGGIVGTGGSAPGDGGSGEGGDSTGGTAGNAVGGSMGGTGAKGNAGAGEGGAPTARGGTGATSGSAGRMGGAGGDDGDDGGSGGDEGGNGGESGTDAGDACPVVPVDITECRLDHPASGVAIASIDLWGGAFHILTSTPSMHSLSVSWGSDSDGTWFSWPCFAWVPYPRRLAAIPLSNEFPEVFITSRCGQVFDSQYDGSIGFLPIFPVPLPSAGSFITDVALSTTRERVNHLYVADRDAVFVGVRTGSNPYAPFGPWSRVGYGGFASVAAGLRGDDRQQVFVLDAQGRSWTAIQISTDDAMPFGGWQDFDSASVPLLVDIEAAYGTNPLEIYAVDAGGTIWTRREDGSGSFEPWSAWDGPVLPEPIATLSAAAPNAAWSALTMVVVGKSGRVYRSWRTESGWAPWQDHPI